MGSAKHRNDNPLLCLPGRPHRREKSCMAGSMLMERFCSEIICKRFTMFDIACTNWRLLEPAKPVACIQPP